MDVYVCLSVDVDVDACVSASVRPSHFNKCSGHKHICCLFLLERSD